MFIHVPQCSVWKRKECTVLLDILLCLMPATKIKDRFTLKPVATPVLNNITYRLPFGGCVDVWWMCDFFCIWLANTSLSMQKKDTVAKGTTLAHTDTHTGVQSHWINLKHMACVILQAIEPFQTSKLSPFCLIAEWDSSLSTPPDDLVECKISIVFSGTEISSNAILQIKWLMDDKVGLSY